MLSSKFEGLPIVLIEAMRHHKPIVASRVGGVPEAVVDGVNGILTRREASSLAEGISKILLDHALYTQMVKSSAALYQRKFSSRNLDRTCEMLRRVASKAERQS